MSNRLAAETSPYLQQHAHNPVDWYPWGEEAFHAARTQSKPVLLSVGYSACHWCHVMAHESFEDAAIAEVMNRLFINIKVDREERPDIDQIYQTAHALLTRRNGGWPLTMFLTPEQKPFYGGTYFPKSPRFGLPGFAEVLERVAQAWREQPGEIEAQNASLLEILSGMQADAPEVGAGPADAIVAAAIDELAGSIDREEGGFGAAPKFPHPAELAFCLRFGARSPRLAAHAAFTLEKMALGGIFDQLAGGFARYSVDRRWMIPHFEKMLYDNGPLLALYADAWTITRSALFARVAESTAQWVMREMQSSEGGYYSSIDADSEHEEGRFYVWSRTEVRELLDDGEYAVAASHFGLDEPPNFENAHWHLYVRRPLVEVADALGLQLAAAQALLEQARGKLLRARGQRVRPGCDDKVLASWNALMIAGMARAARVFGRDDWLDSARRANDFIFERMFDGGRMLATYRQGRAHLNAYLDDYAFCALAQLELLQARFSTDGLQRLSQTLDALLERFEDRRRGGFFFVSHDHEALIVRPKPGFDNATPSGNGAAALALVRAGHLLGEPRYLEAAERTLRLFSPQMAARPSGFPTLCLALAEWLEPTRVVILRGEATLLQAWRTDINHCYLPATVTVAVESDSKGLPTVLDKPLPDCGVNAYVCEGVTCLPAIGSLEDLRSLLGVGCD